jgi:hypothetical protein
MVLTLQAPSGFQHSPFEVKPKGNFAKVLKTLLRVLFQDFLRVRSQTATPIKGPRAFIRAQDLRHRA